MRQPLAGKAHRSRRVLVRKNPRWTELFPHLEEIGLEVVVECDLSGVKSAYREHVQRVQEARRAGMVKPTATAAHQEAALRATPDDWAVLEMAVTEAEHATQAAALRDIFGPLPFRTLPALAEGVLAWNDGCIVKLAAGILLEKE
jgi:hypothetical protein